MPFSDAMEMRATMPSDPHITVKFPKVVPVEVPPPGAASPSSAPELTAERISRPSVMPGWSEETPTPQRGTAVAIVAAAIGASMERPLLTVLSGLNAGQVFTLDREETVLRPGSRRRRAHRRRGDQPASTPASCARRGRGMSSKTSARPTESSSTAAGSSAPSWWPATGSRWARRSCSVSASSRPTRRPSRASSSRARHATG